MNTVTKQCECNPGYYFVYTILSPVTWNGATKSAYNCAVNCTYSYPGCDLNQCDLTQCLQCLFDYMFVYPNAAPRYCEKCSNIHPECKTCSSENTCSTCSTGYGTDPAAVSGKVVCSICDKLVNYCDDCQQINNCLHCVAPYGLAAPLQCMYCELLKVPGCIECTIISAPCTKCNSTSFLLNGTCFFCHI